MPVEQVVLPGKIFAVVTLTRFVIALDDGTKLDAVLGSALGHRRTPKISVGDRVTVERSPYDPDVCRIVTHKRST